MRVELKLIGRLKKNRYIHGNRLVEEVSFTILKRQSVGSLHDLIQDAEIDIASIDFSKYETGIYQLTAVNGSYDIESGYFDDYDLVLIRQSSSK
jgi:hypothetical protein